MVVSMEVVLRRLREAREQEGLTQGQVAELLNYANGTTVSQWELGCYKLRVIDLLELCAVYDVSPAHIFREEE